MFSRAFRVSHRVSHVFYLHDNLIICMNIDFSELFTYTEIYYENYISYNKVFAIPDRGLSRNSSHHAKDRV